MSVANQRWAAGYRFIPIAELINAHPFTKTGQKILLEESFYHFLSKNPTFGYKNSPKVLVFLLIAFFCEVIYELQDQLRVHFTIKVYNRVYYLQNEYA